MAENSKIEWTTHTANLWHGCTKVHAGCDNCYAEALSHRWGNDVWGNNKPRKLIKSFFNDLNKYQRLAFEKGEIHRVFVGSMMDIFEKPMPVVGSDGKTVIDDITTGDMRREFFDFITMGSYPNLMFLLLTKRPSNINKYIPESWKKTPPANVMFGTSPVSQETANKLIPQLMQVNGKRFLSIEPQLEFVDITNNGIKNGYSVPTKFAENGKGIEYTDPGDKFIGVDWVIQGGESGHHRRPFNLDWAYDMQKQCAESGTPYFFKQIDKVLPVPADLLDRQFPN